MRTEALKPLEGRRLLVGISGSIAAVKSPLLVSRLVKAGAQVRCLVTPSAAKLVSPLALSTLSRQRCFQESDEWDPTCARPLHIELAEWAELMVLAPLSASSLSRWSQGLADGLLASTLLACEVPIVAATAMNTAMWNHPAVQSNWEQVQGYPGVVPLLPEAGLLACDRLGDGRMADPQRIELAVRSVFSRDRTLMIGLRDWSGRRLLVTAGPTLEPIDAARWLSNRSSGVMGVLLAQAARLRGADVDLVHGPLDVPQAWLESLRCHRIGTAAEMEGVLQRLQPDVDAIAMAAAVADVR
ncbi:MAG: bifunctional phosphopantothenoylcysteine decarboxylase/phosphopantothenate--cysteine ligase CoaBC, partial [Synechococcus sp.]|nr:bifunctional phosphopantothenoylcysteine decarboxylase/phosphopantothenate--cysteine ligase CoaBC [Synechococcus sp.]